MVVARIIISVLLFSFGTFITYTIAIAIYNLAFHPLKKFPGPKLWAAFALPRYWEMVAGTESAKIKTLHDKYGDVVRISPNCLSFCTSEAWRDIYAHKLGKAELEKDPENIFDLPGTTPDIIHADSTNHARMRKLLAHAFSNNALRAQEDIIHSYCDQLITRLHDQLPINPTVDVAAWLNFTTFDIVGDLGFGESFHSLENGKHHPWVKKIFESLKVMSYVRPMNAYWGSRQLLRFLLTRVPAITSARREHEGYTKDMTLRRLGLNTDRKDFMSYVLRYNDERGMSQEEIIVNTMVLVTAGSETTATAMSGLIFHLSRSPPIMEKLTREIRSAFESKEAMTFVDEAKLPYLQACINEELRIYPPLPILVSRMTSPEGNFIDGHFVPGNFSVGVPHLSASRSARNFKDAESFVPERWLGDARFADDDFGATEPFSIGNRACLGKNMAYAEMRSIMVRMLWNFDMELCEDSTNWHQQKIFTLWEKPPLNVKLTARTGLKAGTSE